MATDFQIHGPFEVPVYPGSSGRMIRAAEGKEFFKRHKTHANRSGCYVFGMRSGRGVKPIYVGRTTRRNFESECFTSHKLLKYNQCLVDYLKGTPVLFFVELPVRRGADNRTHIKELERFLIQTGVAANPNLLNVKGKKEAEWGIVGVLRTQPGRPSQAAQAFKNMMKLRT